MTYEVWAGTSLRRTVRTPDELDAVLGEVEQMRGDEDAPLIATILPVVDGSGVDEIPGLEVGVGHRERASVHWTEITGIGSSIGVEPGVPEWPENIRFDYSGQYSDYDPARTRVTAATARQAAGEYVATGQRPTCLRWPTGKPTP